MSNSSYYWKINGRSRSRREWGELRSRGAQFQYERKKLGSQPTLLKNLGGEARRLVHQIPLECSALQIFGKGVGDTATIVWCGGTNRKYEAYLNIHFDPG
jgi:hypothetical protein